jgi:hypothetical protein
LAGWVEARQDPARFWSLTLREIAVVLEASAERERRDHNDRAWLAHTTAFLSAYHPREPGKFTALAKLQTKPKPFKRRAPAKRGWEDDFAMLQSWTKGNS